MEPKLAIATESTKSSLPPMKVKATHFEYELSYLTEEGVRFQILSKEGDFIIIEVDIQGSWDLTSYGIAMKSCGYKTASQSFENNIAQVFKSVA